MSQPLERSFELKSALALVESALGAAGVRWTVTSTGESAHSASCALHDETGLFLASGHGKGDRLSSVVGAVYEAAEHFWSRFETTDQSGVVYKRASDFRRAHPGLSTRFPLALIDQADIAHLPFRSYAGVTTSASCLYPLALSTPSYLDGLASGTISNPRDEFDYRHLARYSTNSGVAIGANRTEAVIHGLLECVERDALSHFMVDVFLARKSSALRLVDQSSLPRELRELKGRIVEQCRQEVLLFELGNRFGIPVFCAVLDGDGVLATAGYGASLSRHHAVSRSLHEAAQVHLIKTGPGWDERHDAQVLQGLAGHPFHLRCARFDLPRAFRRGRGVVVSYEDTANIRYPTSVDDYLVSLGTILDSFGAQAYSSDLVTFENGVNVSHSFFVGQDHFFLVSYGNLVFPRELIVESAQTAVLSPT